ncbi:MAG: type II toxin-antitoxin system Phd/YefM family antitoxin [Ruminococcaceae bacterium]|nr:type II toxin-antitoxin system Phd/YefM family antitoxin [Oscillospiraceae bacterium]
MPQIRPITDLSKTTEISDICHSRREPIFLTKNGYGDLVIMSMETYEVLTEQKPASTPAPRRYSDTDLDALDALWSGLKAASSTESD